MRFAHFLIGSAAFFFMLMSNAGAQKAPTLQERMKMLQIQMAACDAIDAPRPSDFATGDLANLRKEITALRKQVCLQGIDIQTMEDQLTSLMEEIRRRR